MAVGLIVRNGLCGGIKLRFALGLMAVAGAVSSVFLLFGRGRPRRA